MKKADKERLQRIAELGCIVCRRTGLGETPAELHHIRHGAGMGQKSDRIIPLCSEHHRLGGWGVAIHAGQKTWEASFGTESELADIVDELLIEERNK